MSSAEFINEIFEAKTAISLKPNNAQLHHFLGNLLQRQGDIESAKISQKTAISLDPSLPNAHLKLGQLHEKTGDIDKAISEAKTAVSLNPKNAYFVYFLGNLLLEKGHKEKSKEALIKAAKLNPDKFNFSPSSFELKFKIKIGEIAIIPAGFRCFTRGRIFKNLNFKQPSLPFDSGFFPPAAIVSMLKNPIVNLEYPDNNYTHTVCIKYEQNKDEELGRGIKFQKSSYAEIDELAKDREVKGINKYLDSTFGYYTLDVQHKFVLAHYNWHCLANHEKSQGISDPTINIKNINNILNKRIKRMFDLCNSARYVFFVIGEFQKYQYMMIDNDCYDLNSFNALNDTIKAVFGSQCFVTTVDEIDTADKLLKFI